MVSSIYELIGRLVVLVVRRRFGGQLRVAAAVGIAAAAIGAYMLASREAEEG